MKLMDTLLMSLTVLSITGCAHAVLPMQRGEAVSYAIWNHRTDITLHETKLVAGNGESMAGGFNKYPRLVNSIGWQDGGALSLGDGNHRIPEKATVSWRMPPKPGQPLYGGDLVGPFTISIRSRIPEDVLSQVRGSTTHWVEIGISVGVEPILMRWRLVERGVSGGLREIKRGGDW